MKMYSTSDQTDANGYLWFGTDVDIVTGAMATPNTPQSGAGAGLVSCTVAQTGIREVKLRFWRSEAGPDSGSVLPAANERVNFTLIVS